MGAEKIQVQARGREIAARLAELGSHVRKLEEKRNKDRKNFDILKQDAEKQQQISEIAKHEKRQVVDTLTKARPTVDSDLAWWRRLVAALVVAVCISAVFLILHSYSL